jgi:hypothetical protein
LQTKKEPLPMSDEQRYPVPTRSEMRNRQIAGHECGHTLISRALGDTVWSVTIVPDRGPNGYEGRCVRSGPPSELTLAENGPDKTDEILSICERLERITPELGSARVDLSEYVVRCQNNICALVAGECAEFILHPTLPSLGAQHDHVEAAAFARVAVAAQPATMALLEYCRAEASALLTTNKDILDALVDELVKHGTLSGDQIDSIISGCISARSIAAERERRQDWRTRELSAATFQNEALKC